jgi:hypothetical protein
VERDVNTYGGDVRGLTGRWSLARCVCSSLKCNCFFLNLLTVASRVYSFSHVGLFCSRAAAPVSVACVCSNERADPQARSPGTRAAWSCGTSNGQDGKAGFVGLPGHFIHPAALVIDFLKAESLYTYYLPTYIFLISRPARALLSSITTVTWPTTRRRRLLLAQESRNPAFGMRIHRTRFTSQPTLENLMYFLPLISSGSVFINF